MEWISNTNFHRPGTVRYISLWDLEKSSAHVLWIKWKTIKIPHLQTNYTLWLENDRNGDKFDTFSTHIHDKYTSAGKTHIDEKYTSVGNTHIYMTNIRQQVTHIYMTNIHQRVTHIYMTNIHQRVTHIYMTNIHQRVTHIYMTNIHQRVILNHFVWIQLRLNLRFYSNVSATRPSLVCYFIKPLTKMTFLRLFYQ